MHNKKLFLFDIDGTIAIDNDLIPGTTEILKYISDIGGKYVFITNNSTKGVDDYIRKFEKWKIPVDESNFVTSTTATVRYLTQNKYGKKIFVLGTQSFIAELKKSNLNVTEDIEDDVSCALVAYDSELRYDKLTKICEILETKNEIEYIATNPDLVCPTTFGFVPDCGAICTMIEMASGRKPFYAGKPNKEIVDMCLELTGFSKEETIIVGDRLYTDIACGINAGIDTAVVFTGEVTKQDMENTQYQATWQYDSIMELYKAIAI